MLFAHVPGAKWPGTEPTETVSQNCHNKKQIK